MDRSWIKTPYISDNYQKGVEDLLQFAQQNAPVLVVKYFFPCVKCVNGRHQSLNDIRSHLICKGFSLTYTNWIWHGELPHMSTSLHTNAVDVQTRDHMEDMIHNLGQEGFRHAHAPYYEKLQTDLKKPLYLGCITFTRLLAVLALVNLKVRFRWSDKASLSCLCYWKICFLTITCYQRVTTRKKRYYVLWVWSARKFTHVLTIVFYTEMSFRKCATARHVGYHATKWMMANAVIMQPQTTVVQQRFVGIFQ